MPTKAEVWLGSTWAIEIPGSIIAAATHVSNDFEFLSDMALITAAAA